MSAVYCGQTLASTESATSRQSATSQCLSALPGRLWRGKFVLFLSFFLSWVAKTQLNPAQKCINRTLVGHEPLTCSKMCFTKMEMSHGPMITPVPGSIFGPLSRSFFTNKISTTRFQVLLYLISNWHYFVFMECIHLPQVSPNWKICRKKCHSLFSQKKVLKSRGFVGGGFAIEMKLRSISSANKTSLKRLLGFLEKWGKIWRYGRSWNLVTTVQSLSLGKLIRNPSSCYRRKS